MPVLPNDLQSTVGEVQRVLKPDGLLVIVEPWQTPFLQFVHHIAALRLARRLSRRMDALMTMIEHERETYEQWLGQPDRIMAILSAAFEPVRIERGWGKLLFIGRRT